MYIVIVGTTEFLKFFIVNCICTGVGTHSGLGLWCFAATSSTHTAMLRHHDDDIILYSWHNIEEGFCISDEISSARRRIMYLIYISSAQKVIKVKTTYTYTTPPVWPRSCLYSAAGEGERVGEWVTLKTEGNKNFKTPDYAHGHTGNCWCGVYYNNAATVLCTAETVRDIDQTILIISTYI